MEPLLLYVLKASGLLFLFLTVYQLFLKQETFYTVNRHFLLIGLLASLILPSMGFTHYIETTTAPLSQTGSIDLPKEAPEYIFHIDYITISFIIYSAGVLFLLIKLALQLLAIVKLIKTNKVIRKGRYFHVILRTGTAPFSFFNYIFYNPKHFTQVELSTILRHEEAHSSQWHSFDILLSRIVSIFLWINPFSWYYQIKIKQNLEFMADAHAIHKMASVKSYQYTLLKVSGNALPTPLINNFYNSLIKKRIVMLNKSKSKNSKILKTMLILPLLAIFLVSFNTETVYILKMDGSDHSSTKTPYQLIEITINKNTTDQELRKIKKDLLKKGVDFSYSLAHNSKNEITDITVNFTTTNKEGKKINSSSNFSSDNEGIEPIHIVYNEDTNSFSIGNNKDLYYQTVKDISPELDEDDDDAIWISSEGDKKEHKTIEIANENGKETIKVNGKKISREEFDALKEKEGIQEEHSTIRKSGGNDSESTIKINISDENASDATKNKEKIAIHSVNEPPLVFIDGRESDEKEMRAMNPAKIASINVLKGEAAQKKYGKKGENGVIEITSKNQ
ncbi:M56 family metallopeptidase [Maribacter polysaccharolyticus]|uniref:M56 family metallopeptidase n=1 Tax=Maribacter polysaccharolyticus TaxID=3020831 RepID=UPI00237F08DB|nr:M56 family metallopeptidase [Maribacter polysaccharolyticus]MDE3741804.1 M56 family metallopeptidase [Maribacter polysaccharolyticus]